MPDLPIFDALIEYVSEKHTGWQKVLAWVLTALFLLLAVAGAALIVREFVQAV